MRRAGLLNEIIQIYKPTTVVNDYGERVETYDLLYTTRARVVNDGGGRNLVNSEIFYGYSKSFVVRYYVPVENICRIKWQNNDYRVISVEKRRDTNDILIKTELINE